VIGKVECNENADLGKRKKGAARSSGPLCYLAVVVGFFTAEMTG
jgi:hypothetical protein